MSVVIYLFIYFNVCELSLLTQQEDVNTSPILCSPKMSPKIRLQAFKPTREPLLSHPIMHVALIQSANSVQASDGSQELFCVLVLFLNLWYTRRQIWRIQNRDN